MMINILFGRPRLREGCYIISWKLATELAGRDMGEFHLEVVNTQLVTMGA